MEDPPEVAQYAFDEATERELRPYFSTQTLETAAALGEMMDAGDLTEVTAGRLASSLGAEPAAVKEQFSRFQAAYATQAGSVVSKEGADPEGFLAWAKDRKEGDLKRAISDHVKNRDVSGYQKLARAYMADLDTIDPDRILNAEFAHGIEARKAPGGRIYLRTPDGQEIPWRNAYLGGLVSLG